MLVWCPDIHTFRYPWRHSSHAQTDTHPDVAGHSETCMDNHQMSGQCLMYVRHLYTHQATHQMYRDLWTFRHPSGCSPDVCTPIQMLVQCVITCLETYWMSRHPSRCTSDVCTVSGCSSDVWTSILTLNRCLDACQTSTSIRFQQHFNTCQASGQWSGCLVDIQSLIGHQDIFQMFIIWTPVRVQKAIWHFLGVCTLTGLP